MNLNLSSEKSKKNIKVSITASMVYSLAMCKVKAPLIYSVSVSGITMEKVRNVSFSVYGMSKAGFFTAHSKVPVRSIFTGAEGENVVFDFSDFDCGLKEEFFRTLKSATAGKICVEVTVDGVKYFGDCNVSLLPARIYPHAATPLIFASMLSPCSSEIKRITAACEKSLEGLYSALRSERMIYSVRDCDIVSHDIEFEDADTVFCKRSKMALPLEMAMIFCSCALNIGLRPVIAVIKNSRAPRFLCGVCREESLFGVMCASGEKLSELVSDGKLSLFDISCLFTGHNVDIYDACTLAGQEMSSQDVYFALDICEALRRGADFCSLDLAAAGEEKAFVERLRTPKARKKHSLSDYAERLSDTAHTPLLNFSFLSHISLPVCFSDISAVSSLALCGKKLSVVSVADRFDMRRFASMSEGICSMIVPAEYKRAELTFAEKQDTVESISEFRKVLSENEKRLCVSTLLRQHETAEVAKYVCGHMHSEIYLACGFLHNGKSFAPAALYPVSLKEEKGIVYIEFLAPKPYVNRLLCEKLKENPEAKRFFDGYGFPGGSLDNIINCFEKFCTSVNGGYKLIKECAVTDMPYQNSFLAFSIVDKAERIMSDSISSAIIGTAEYANTSAPEVSDQRIAELESASVGFFGSPEYEVCAAALDGDVLAENADGNSSYNISVLVASENVKTGKTTLFCSDNAVVRSELERRFDELFISDAVLSLSRENDIKEAIKNKLESVSRANVTYENSGFDEEYHELRRKLDRYNRSKTSRYAFDFSFADAAEAYIRAGEGLSAEEKLLLPEPENIFLPDMGKESVTKLFSSSIKLCRARSAIRRAEPYITHPLYYAKLECMGEGEEKTCAYLAEKCAVEFDELSASCERIAKNAGFDISDIKTLPALHSFLSLLVLVSKEYDSGITEKLLLSDIYAVSKRIAETRSLAAKISDTERELCEFERDVYSLDVKKLLAEWLNPDTMSHSEITKTVNAYRTVSVSSDIQKKSVAEVLNLLYAYADLMAEFSQNDAMMQELFAGYWNGKNTDWNKLSKLIDFTKTADILLKKIYGTDTESRKSTATSFPIAAKYCADCVNSAGILGAAGLFDRMFSDDGSFVSLSKLLCCDYYNMSFDSGLFSADGMKKVLCGWKDASAELGFVAEYNKCCAECEKIGLGCFVRYFENNAYTPSSEKIFARSLLYLAQKQIALYDKTFLSSHDYTGNVLRFAELHKARVNRNVAELRAKHLYACAAYIRSNPEKAAAFSESLGDPSFSAEDILLRYCETIKAMFPIIIAEPSMAGMLGDFENAVYPESDLCDTAKIIPFLHNARHRLIMSYECSEEKECFACDCKNAGLPTLKIQGLSNNGFGLADKISYRRAAVSSYDKIHGTNVLEAQTIGLELIKLYDEKAFAVADILTFTTEQCAAVRSVLSAVAEKSVGVRDALSDGRITVGFAGDRRSVCCDVLYISTVFGKDEASSMCTSCGALDDVFGASQGISDMITSALSGCARNIVVVSSISPDVCPDRAGSFGIKQLLKLAAFAQSFGKMRVAGEEGVVSPCVSEFGRLVSENGFCVCETHDENSAVLDIGGKNVAAVFEKTGSRAAFDRECRTLCEWEMRGYQVHRLDCADMALNPLKILDSINNLTEENK